MSSDLQLVQIALSCSDHNATADWYRDVFGYLPALGYFNSEEYSGPVEFDQIQGIGESALRVRWLLDQQDFFQLELFEYRQPTPRPLPTSWRPCDIGYTIIGLHVSDFDATLRRLSARDTRLLNPPLKARGRRRACIRDPNGVVLELMEDDPRVPGSPPRLRPEVPVVARCVRASVPDLERALAYFVDTVGLRRHADQLHNQEHERLWGLPDAQVRVELLSAGDFWLELAAYEQPRPEPWADDYRLSDLGILNIAFGTRDRDNLRAIQRAVVAGGYSANPSNDVGFGEFMYTTDDQGFSVEFMYLDREADGLAGFAPDLA